MKVWISAGLVLALAVSSAVGQVRSGNDTGPAVRSRTPSTLAFLNERIEEVSFQDAPLDAVMSWLGELTPMNVVVRWQVLIDAGIERDKPITMQVKNLRLSQVLWMIMDEAGGPDLKLAYRASGELLIISTAEDLGKEMVVRVYDVSDLLVRAPRFTGAPRMDLSNNQGSGGQGGGSGQSVFGGGSGGGGQNEDDDNRGNNQDDDADIQELIALIVQTVEPDSWADNGGLGTIQSFRNLLVVRNNILVHQALGGYVEESE
jgi:uncharacterized membrane protein YgcG